MGAGKISLQKASGGVTSITGVDGTGNTEVTVPESGELATKEYVDSLKTIATGTATFDSTTNNINLTGIGIGVEIGDVIQISGADDAKNNSEFTIEVITDANNIIVNQAHANKGTTKNVAAQVGDTGVTVKLLAKWYNAPIGLGQGWVDVKGSRIIGTSYSITKRHIQVNIGCGASNTAIAIADAYINNIHSGRVYFQGVQFATGTLSFVVPQGGVYKCENIQNSYIVFWAELR